MKKMLHLFLPFIVVSSFAATNRVITVPSKAWHLGNHPDIDNIATSFTVTPVGRTYGYFIGGGTNRTFTWTFPREFVFDLTRSNLVASFSIVSTNGITESPGQLIAFSGSVALYTNSFGVNAIGSYPTNTMAAYYDNYGVNPIKFGRFWNGTNINYVNFTNTLPPSLMNPTVNVGFGTVTLIYNASFTTNSSWLLDAHLQLQ